MKAKNWIKAPVHSLLDIGCHDGAWLHNCSHLYPNTKLVGADIDKPNLEKAKKRLPSAEFHHTSAENLPFPNETFQYVTCTEVLEHLPIELRGPSLQEIRRVLKPGGTLIITVPHAGWFAWLDSNNMRLRMPSLYSRIVKQGLRDPTYTAFGRHVEWHHHFTYEELRSLAGTGWKESGQQRGGLILFPLMDWLSWPFYKLQMPQHPVRRLFEKIAGLDYSIDYGPKSYGILLALERI